MNYCVNCGNPLPDGAKFCGKCGQPTVLPAPSQPMQRGNTPPVNNAVTYGAPPVIGTPRSRPMAWYKFVIWVQLILMALIYVERMIRCIIGMTTSYIVYDTYAGKLFDSGVLEFQIPLGSGQSVYMVTSLHGFNVINVPLILVWLACLVLTIAARHQLARYKKNGPMLYYLCLASGTVGDALRLLYIEIVNHFTMTLAAANWISLGTSAAVAAIMIALNVVYFGKRKDQFCN